MVEFFDVSSEKRPRVTLSHMMHETVFTLVTHCPFLDVSVKL